MKKIILSNDLKNLLLVRNSLLDGLDAAVFTAATNDELLEIHGRENATLLITQLDTAGMSCEELMRQIRMRETLKRVSVIIICKDTLAQRERARNCGANAVFTLPVDISLLNVKIRHLLAVARRKRYQMALAVAVPGGFKHGPRPFRTENVSASGMLMHAEESLTKGDGIFFSFFLPDGSHASGYGEIARIVQLDQSPESYLYGVKFTDVAPVVRQAIDAFVDPQMLTGR